MNKAVTSVAGGAGVFLFFSFFFSSTKDHRYINCDRHRESNFNILVSHGKIGCIVYT